ANPRIVYCSISGYGQTGPYREKAGHDIDYCAYAGISDQIGARGGPPVVPNFQIADLVGGSLSGAMGILAALVDAQRTGRGR
ncbi:MAG: CoA transferase, partial [Burkholderiales bacterium]|nr:CoA transferase [Burkholderiales bacterium]